MQGVASLTSGESLSPSLNQPAVCGGAGGGLAEWGNQKEILACSSFSPLSSSHHSSPLLCLLSSFICSSLFITSLSSSSPRVCALLGTARAPSGTGMEPSASQPLWVPYLSPAQGPLDMGVGAQPCSSSPLAVGSLCILLCWGSSQLMTPLIRSTCPAGTLSSSVPWCSIGPASLP